MSWRAHLPPGFLGAIQVYLYNLLLLSIFVWLNTALMSESSQQGQASSVAAILKKLPCVSDHICLHTLAIAGSHSGCETAGASSQVASP